MGNSDDLLSHLAQRQSHVKGIYFQSAFSGTAVMSETNGSKREELLIQLDRPTFVKVSPLDKGKVTDILLISADHVELGHQSIREG